MAKFLSVDETDLLNFFEVEPTSLDTDMPWVYNDSVYETGDGRRRISFAISPYVGDVRILLTLDDVLVYEFSAVGVENVRYHNDKERELLQIMVSARDSLWLRIRPTISITHLCDAQT